MAFSLIAAIRKNKNTIAWHSLLWIVLESPGFISRLNQPDFGKYCLMMVVLILIAATPVYLNMYVWVPKYLYHEKYIKYFLALAASIVIFAVVKERGYTFFKTEFLKEEIAASSTEWIIRNIITLSIFTAVFSGITLTIDWVRQLRINRALEVEKLKSEVQYLKAQINPHFLFNTLNNLYALTLTKSDLAPLTILKLSEIMEFMVYHSNEPLVPVQKELEYLHNYIELEKLRSEKPENIVFNVSGNAEGLQMSPLLLLPFVENGFKHGMYTQGSAAKLTVTVLLTKEQLQLSVINTLQEANLPVSKAKPNGFGLDNVKKRLQYLYPKRHSLTIAEHDRLHTVILHISL